MRRLRQSDGSIVDLSDAEFAAWLAIFNAIHNSEPPNEVLAAELSRKIDAVRAFLGRPPLRLAA